MEGGEEGRRRGRKERGRHEEVGENVKRKGRGRREEEDRKKNR